MPPFYTWQANGLLIRLLPADLRLVAWHEQAGFFLPGGSKGEKISIKEVKAVTSQ